MEKQTNINWDNYGYKWIPVEEKESILIELSTKTRWSFEKSAQLLADADGFDLIPVYGFDWWINFVKTTK